MAKYKLNDIAPIQQGDVPKANEYWLLNLDMVESNTGKVIDYVYCDESEIGNSTVRFDTRNVLYSKLRPYLNKVVIPEKAGYATSEMLPMRPNPEIVTREYLTYYLRSPSFVSYINEKTSGAKMPRANSSDLKEYLIECPEIFVQERITAQFDKLVSIIDARKAELDKLDELIKARFVELFGEDLTHTDITIGDIAEEATVGIANSATQAYADSGIVMFRNQNIRINYLDDSDLIYITPDFAAKYENKKLKENDILITRTGVNIGMACLVPKRYEGCQTFTTLILRIKDNIGVSPTFVCYYINSPLGKGFIDDRKVGGAQPNFGAKQLVTMPIVIPSKEKQEDFAELVKQIDKSKFVVQKALNETHIMYDSLMQKYFG